MGLKGMRRVTIGSLALLGACATTFAVREAYAGESLPRGTHIDRIVVDKSDRRMEVYRGQTLLKTYRIGIGRGGLGDKGWEGDGVTPEGTYRIDERHRSQNFHRFLHVSYPNRGDRRRYRASLQAGDVPTDDEGQAVGIGGAIGIHGTGGHDWIPRRFRGTLGCIMVDDDEAAELYRSVAPNAVIEIRR